MKDAAAKPSIRQAHKDLTRARIAEAARQCFYDKGVAETSFEDIATASGVRRATIYLHFANKNAILTELLAQNLDEVYRLYERIAGLPVHDARSVRKWLDGYVRMLSRNRQAMRLFQTAMAIDETSRELIERYRVRVVDMLAARYPAFAGDDMRGRAAAFMMIVAIDFVADAAAQRTTAFDHDAAMDLVASDLSRMLRAG